MIIFPDFADLLINISSHPNERETLKMIGLEKNRNMSNLSCFYRCKEHIISTIAYPTIFPMSRKTFFKKLSAKVYAFWYFYPYQHTSARISALNAFLCMFLDIYTYDSQPYRAINIILYNRQNGTPKNIYLLR